MKKTTEILRRARERMAKAETKGTVTELATSFGIGFAKSKGLLEKLPPIMGSRLVTLAAAGFGIGYFSKGTLGEVAMGVGKSAANIALFQLGEGGIDAVSGLGAPGPLMMPGNRVADELRAMAAAANLDEIEIDGEFLDVAV
jgi:hypothetical protein